MKLLLLFATLPLAAATITTPGLWEWSVLTETSRATGTISWDGTRYQMQETGGIGPDYRFGLLGFSGTVADPDYPHRIILVFNSPSEPTTFLRRLESYIPIGLGYLPYAHLYGGDWPPDIPRWLGDCEEPWRVIECGNCPGLPDSSPDVAPVPESASWLLWMSALLWVALRSGRR